MKAWKQETESVDYSLSLVYYNTDLIFKTSLAQLGDRRTLGAAKISPKTVDACITT